MLDPRVAVALSSSLAASSGRRCRRCCSSWEPAAALCQGTRTWFELTFSQSVLKCLRKLRYPTLPLSPRTPCVLGAAAMRPPVQLGGDCMVLRSPTPVLPLLMAGMPWRAVGCSWRLLVEVPGSYQESDIEHVEFARCAELIGFDFGNLQQS